tara:strand:- start:1106 stop:2509 length:1404 start_codon:yes stop_codon:yes gene_type:complete
MASVRISRTPSSGGNRKTFTFSAWIKRGNLEETTQTLLMSGDDNGNNNISVLHLKDNQLEFYTWVGGYQHQVTTTRVFKDTTAWYHIVVAVDTTQSTASDRVKMYVNGSQETSFANSSYMSQNYDTFINHTVLHGIANYNAGTSQYFDGCMAHIHLTDGTAYAASDFGESDSVSGIWKPKTAPSVTHGTNGFFLKFENSGNLDLDSSTNNHTFTTSGTLTQNVDTPSNNFCVLNFLDRARTATNNLGDALENANTTFNTSNAVKATARGTIGVQAGKWYWEAKYNGGTAWATGICLEELLADNTAQFWDSSSILAVAINGGSGTLYVNGRSSDSWNTGVSFSSGDIFGFALDVDNQALYIHRNGTYLTANSNVGNPTSGSSRTGSVLGELTTGGYQNYIPDGKYVFPFCQDVSTGASTTIYMNFGNGRFGTTALASSNSDSAGLGLFEYSVPSGYYSLCTKNIKDYG